MSTSTDPVDRIAYRPTEAAARLGIGRTQFYEQVAAGKIPARKLGRSTLILHEDLVEFARSLPTADDAA